MNNKLNETPWESCGIHLWKFKVEGGYLYLYCHQTEGYRNMVFVPDVPKTQCELGDHNYRIMFGKGSCTDCGKEYTEQGIAPSEQVDKLMAPYQDLLNKVADLSMKLSKMESLLRELEKQRVNPKFEEANHCIDRLIGINNDLVERIENLESKIGDE
jgi:hypothetical protein